jgi:DNA-binding CsgD family transcriptional regulator
MKSLTIQEKRILKLVSEGYSSKRIAQAIGISIYTVDTYRKNLLSKLDARNTAELILKAVKANIIKVSLFR